MSGVESALVEIVGERNVLTDGDAMSGYLVDWMGRYSGIADAVVRPRTVGEVAAVVKVAAAAKIQICIQGGNTGLVGGSVPPATAEGRRRIVLSTARMTDLDAVDPIGRCVGAQAGATIAAIDAHAAVHGLMFPVDLASRDSATAGGVVATNAGGIRMIRHGNTRAAILGIEAVRANGDILRRWSPLVKDNVGYDIPGLLAGSEGTLAIITRVLFRLVSPPLATVVVVAALERVADALALIGRAREAGLAIEAAEFMTHEGVDLVAEHGSRRPVCAPAPYHLLLEVSGAGDTETAVVDLLDDAEGIVDAVLEPGPARALWKIREGHTEAIARATTTPVVKLDVSFPIRSLPHAIAELQDLPGHLDVACRPILFGHVGDGNIHVNLLDVPAEAADTVTEAVFGVVDRLDGSISAEHGIGRAKTAWTRLGRSPIDLATMRVVKDALDPQGLLNPGVLFG
ncbi:FAD-binding oxidoreductase [Gordonia oryzae]|uniref:FAD-binding oxidoreductase n=1 Tax=Gordonia oryzae TaxID=2487349 RepID=A0A3N4GI85_9ACTN|nr:FAD-binding oxidoreductase [Gordonia oryzae]RPA61077.1 FAD-binding oxidoreductase [Gordonia oryzae]